MAEGVKNSERFPLTWGTFRVLDTLRYTAKGPDNLPAWFLCLGTPLFAAPVMQLFNMSLSSIQYNGMWPIQVPIHRYKYQYNGKWPVSLQSLKLLLLAHPPIIDRFRLRLFYHDVLNDS